MPKLAEPSGPDYCVTVAKVCISFKRPGKKSRKVLRAMTDFEDGKPLRMAWEGIVVEISK